MEEPTDFLVIGHVLKDLTDSEYQMGGTAIYASLTALHLGRRVALVTSAPLDVDLSRQLPGIQIWKRPSKVTSTFKNLETPLGRRQWVYAVASSLMVEDVPQKWLETPVVLLGPVVGEVPEETVFLFPKSLVGLSLQGWLRAIAEDGTVYYKPWQDNKQVLPDVGVLFLSKEDVQGDETVIETYAKAAPLTVVTQGHLGARVHEQGRWDSIPAFPTQVQDPTGAGDAFAAAFLIALEEGQGAVAAARFASCVASFVVEGRGTTSIPTRAQVERRLQEAPRLPR